MKSKLLKGLITLSLSISTILGSTLLSSKDIVAHASSKVVVTASVLNIREKQNTSSKIIGTVRKGQKLEVLKSNSKWSQIKLNKKIGYVSNDYISILNCTSTTKNIKSKSIQTKKVQSKRITPNRVQTKENTSNTSNYNATVTASNLNFRKTASVKSSIIGTIKKGSKVKVITLNGDWAYIEYNGKKGYVSKQYLKISPNSNPIQEKTTKTNIVTTKNTNKNSIKLTNKNNINTTSKKTSKPTPIKVAYVTASNLNVRSGKGTNYGIKAILPNGTKVEILQETGDWSKIKYGNSEGYVTSRYLTSNKIYNTTEVHNTVKTDTTIKNNSNINQTDWVSKLKVSKQTNQLVTVQATGTNAVVQFHQKDSKGKWSKVFDVNGYIGYNGLGNPTTRREGDRTTPTGVYDFGQLFGVAPNPGTKMQYTQLTPNHWWVGDSNSKYFNTLQDRRVTGKSWSTDGGEAIIDKPGAYKYGIAINFNMNRKTAYRGWGIHFHCIAGSSHSTAGCVEIPPSFMKEFLQQVEPGAKIVISTPNGIYNY